MLSKIIETFKNSLFSVSSGVIYRNFYFNKKYITSQFPDLFQRIEIIYDSMEAFVYILIFYHIFILCISP